MRLAPTLRGKTVDVWDRGRGTWIRLGMVLTLCGSLSVQTGWKQSYVDVGVKVMDVVGADIVTYLQGSFLAPVLVGGAL